MKCFEQGLSRIDRTTFSRYYEVNLEKCEIVFKHLASNCIKGANHYPGIKTECDVSCGKPFVLK